MREENLKNIEEVGELVSFLEKGDVLCESSRMVAETGKRKRTEKLLTAAQS